MLIEVYDIETLSNLFTYTGFDATNKQWYQFVISKWRNDLELLYSHLFRDKMWMCGYNNEGLIKNLFFIIFIWIMIIKLV